MKKAISLLLALLILCTGTALATEWQPGRPYEGVPEIDLTQSLGYIIFYPNDTLNVEHACQYLYVYLPRTDVEVGSGSLHVQGASGELLTIPMVSDAVTLRPMLDEEMAMFMWQDGVCFEVRLSRTLPLNESCHVELDANCIAVTDSELSNEEIVGPNEWPIFVAGDFGVGSMEYLRGDAAVTAPITGDTIRFDLTIGGDAAIASIYSPDASVNFTANSFTESGEVIGEITGDAPFWGVIFLDANGNELGRVMFD